MKFTKYVLVLGSFAMPFLAFAQQTNLGPIRELVINIGRIIGILIPIAIALLFLVFIWGLIKYVLNASDENAKAEGKRLMIGGILALFVVVAVWGIIEFLGGLIGLDEQSGELGGQIEVPQVEGLPRQ